MASTFLDIPAVIWNLASPALPQTRAHSAYTEHSIEVLGLGESGTGWQPALRPRTIIYYGLGSKDAAVATAVQWGPAKC